jgi:hypothetical protein
MALVVEISRQKLEKDVSHKTVQCTYSVVTGSDGKRYLQLDTYGSSERKIKGKKSQSIRFAPAAISELSKILSENNLVGQ